MSIVKSCCAVSSRRSIRKAHLSAFGFAVATLILWWILGTVGMARPHRNFVVRVFLPRSGSEPPVRGDLVIAPADGVVSFAGFAAPPPELGLGMATQRVSIFMSIFDCHVNRAPVQGRVAQIVYHPGLFLNSRPRKAERSSNERNSIVIDLFWGGSASSRSQASSGKGSSASPTKALS